MGATVSAYGFFVNVKSTTTPDISKQSKFDENFGFDGPRRERVMIATEAEMVSAKVPLYLRDYCAHLYIAYEGCKKENVPFFYRCSHERHAYEECQLEDYLTRMKEYEREERLLKRKERIERKEAAKAAKEHLPDC